MKFSNSLSKAKVVKAVSLFERMVSNQTADNARKKLKMILQNSELWEKVQNEIGLTHR